MSPAPASHRIVWTAAPNWASGTPFCRWDWLSGDLLTMTHCCPQGLADLVGCKVSIFLRDLRPGAHRASAYTALVHFLEVTVCTALYTQLCAAPVVCACSPFLHVHGAGLQAREPISPLLAEPSEKDTLGFASSSNT